MFISFEGLDFSGKTTQIGLLRKYFEEQGETVKIIREPGGTLISEKIREILLDKKNSGMVDESELLLFAASRAQLVREIINPALQTGMKIISDRFYHSSIAYQGYGRELNLNFVLQLQDFAVGKIKPDMTFFIDIPISEVERRKNVNFWGQADRIESAKRGFFEKVRNGYLELFEGNEKATIIDGCKTPEEIHNTVIETISKLEKRIKGE